MPYPSGSFDPFFIRVCCLRRSRRCRRRTSDERGFDPFFIRVCCLRQRDQWEMAADAEFRSLLHEGVLPTGRNIQQGRDGLYYTFRSLLHQGGLPTERRLTIAEPEKCPFRSLLHQGVPPTMTDPIAVAILTPTTGFRSLLHQGVLPTPSLVPLDPAWQPLMFRSLLHEGVLPTTGGRCTATVLHLSNIDVSTYD